MVVQFCLRLLRIFDYIIGQWGYYYWWWFTSWNTGTHLPIYIPTNKFLSEYYRSRWCSRNIWSCGVTVTSENLGVSGVYEVTERPGVTVTSTEAIAEWRRIRQEQDEEYEI